MNKPPEDDEFDHDVDDDEEDDEDDDDDESSTFQMADPPVRNPSAGTVRNPSAGTVPKKEEVPRPPAAKTRPSSGKSVSFSLLSHLQSDSGTPASKNVRSCFLIREF